MSARYVLAPAARQDRKDIFAYTHQRSDSIEIARRVDRKLKEELERIARTPTIGHKHPNLPITEHLLVRAVFSYLVIYNPSTRPVRILRIWHGAQEKPETPGS